MDIYGALQSFEFIIKREIIISNIERMLLREYIIIILFQILEDVSVFFLQYWQKCYLV